MQSTSIYQAQLERLRAVLAVREDQDVAAALGMTKAALSARKKRGSFPEKELYALAAKRPELGIDVDYVLTGITADSRGLLEASRARAQRAADAGLDFEQLRALSNGQGPGPTPARLQKLVTMLQSMRATEFEAVYTLAKSITELREDLVGVRENEGSCVTKKGAA